MDNEHQPMLPPKRPLLAFDAGDSIYFVDVARVIAIRVNKSSNGGEIFISADGYTPIVRSFYDDGDKLNAILTQWQGIQAPNAQR